MTGTPLHTGTAYCLQGEFVDCLLILYSVVSYCLFIYKCCDNASKLQRHDERTEIHNSICVHTVITLLKGVCYVEFAHKTARRNETNKHMKGERFTKQKYGL